MSKEFDKLLDAIYGAYRAFFDAIHTKMRDGGKWSTAEFAVMNESGEPVEIMSNFDGDMYQKWHIDKVRYINPTDGGGSYQIHVCKIDDLAADRWTSWYEWYDYELKKIYEYIHWG